MWSDQHLFCSLIHIMLAAKFTSSKNCIHESIASERRVVGGKRSATNKWLNIPCCSMRSLLGSVHETKAIANQSPVCGPSTLIRRIDASDLNCKLYVLYLHDDKKRKATPINNVNEWFFLFDGRTDNRLMSEKALLSKVTNSIFHDYTVFKCPKRMIPFIREEISLPLISM